MSISKNEKINKTITTITNITNITNDSKKEEPRGNGKNNMHMNKGLLTSTINAIYKHKKNYSHIHTYYPSNAFPSYDILIRLLSKIWDFPIIKGFKKIKKYKSLLFYQNIDNPKIILIGILDTNPSSFHEVYTGIRNTIIKIDLRKIKRYITDLQDLIDFQKTYPIDEYYYTATGISIAGAVADLFLEEGLIDEAISFNAVVEDRFISNSNIKNYRIYLDEDILYLGMGRFAPNTKVYSMNVVKKIFINPIKEFNHLFKLHTLYEKRSSSLSFIKKILKTDKTGDDIVKEDWNNLFNKRLKLIENNMINNK